MAGSRRGPSLSTPLFCSARSSLERRFDRQKMPSSLSCFIFVETQASRFSDCARRPAARSGLVANYGLSAHSFLNTNLLPSSVIQKKTGAPTGRGGRPLQGLGRLPDRTRSKADQSCARVHHVHFGAVKRGALNEGTAHYPVGAEHDVEALPPIASPGPKAAGLHQSPVTRPLLRLRYDRSHRGTRELPPPGARLSRPS